MTLIYKTRTASYEEIHRLLEECDTNFIPPLSSRVDLLAYARKIFENAISFEAWDANVLVGMVNTYLSDASTRTGFITNVSVLREHRGKGIAFILLQMCLDHPRRIGFSRVRLETSLQNAPAIRLYSRAGFRTVEVSGGNLLMECEITGKETEELQ